MARSKNYIPELNLVTSNKLSQLVALLQEYNVVSVPGLGVLKLKVYKQSKRKGPWGNIIKVGSKPHVVLNINDHFRKNFQ